MVVRLICSSIFSPPVTLLWITEGAKGVDASLHLKKWHVLHPSTFGARVTGSMVFLTSLHDEDAFWSARGELVFFFLD
jgi:hypothetical protein